MIFNFEYVSSGQYIYVSKDLRIRCYFSKPKWVREQKKFGTNCSREVNKEPDYKIQKTNLKCGSPRSVTGPTSFESAIRELEREVLAILLLISVSGCCKLRTGV